MTKKKTTVWGKKTAPTGFVKSRGTQRGWSQKTCAEANDFVMNDLRHRALGGPCPVCLQTCKVYRRSFTADMAYFLIQLFKLKPEEDGFVDVNKIELRGGDYAKTTYWGLVEHKPKDPKDKKRRTSGRWRLTSQGRAFVQKITDIPSHVFIYNGKFEDFDWTDEIDIIKALGEFFDYEAMMQPTPEENK